jgi:hypothetical protein
MKKRLVLIVSLVIFCMLANVSLAQSADDLSKSFLDSLPGCTPVMPEDNLIGLAIDSIEIIDGEYVLTWSSTNVRIQDDAINSGVIYTMLTFYDPEDYTKTSVGYTVENGYKMCRMFGKTSTMKQVPVYLTTPSNVVFMYFPGIDYLPEMYTAPLFFTLILGENPHVYEATPRLANGLFADEQAEAANGQQN